MVYELWELAAGNRIGEYETEGEALREVLGAIRLYGAQRVDTLLLDGVDEPRVPRGRSVLSRPS